MEIFISLFDIWFYIIFCFERLYKREPKWVWFFILIGNNFNHISISQFLIEWMNLVIYLGHRDMISELCMHIVGKVYRSRASWLSVSSLSSFTQFTSLAILLHFSLYSKCAATHISACLCILSERICISVGCLVNCFKNQIIVVWIELYPFGFGSAT